MVEAGAPLPERGDHGRAHGREARPAAQIALLDLVDHDHLGVWDGRLEAAVGWSEVEQEGDAADVGTSGQVERGLRRQLSLQQQYRGAVQELIRDPQGRRVGAQGDDDHVLASLIDDGHGDPGGKRGLRNVPAVNAELIECAQKFVPEAVLADRTGQSDLSAEPARGDRLIEALAAGNALYVASVDRLARPWEVGHRGHQVVVQAARNSDPGYEAPLL